MSVDNLHLLSPSRVTRLLNGMGYQVKILDHNGMLFVETVACGVNLKIRLWDPHPTMKDGYSETFQLSAEWGPEKNRDITFTRNLCNLFNEEKRFCKASIAGDDENAIISLRHDVIALDGISDRTFKANFDFFISHVQIFIDEVLGAVDIQAYDNYEKYHQALNYQYGIEADIEAAIDLYWQAATGGFAAAQNNLGDLYENGNGVDLNERFALYWYTRATERGEPTAYIGLAMLLLKNTEDRDILIESAKYAILATEKLPDGINKSISEQFLFNLIQRLSEDELERANHLAATWRPLFQEPMLQSDTMNFVNANSEAKPILQ